MVNDFVYSMSLRIDYLCKQKFGNVQKGLEACGVSKNTTYVMRQSGSGGPTAATIVKLCDTLDCTADWLLGREGYDAPPN